MKKLIFLGFVLGLLFVTALSGCGGGGGGTSYTPGQSRTYTLGSGIGEVSIIFHYVPSAASFPTGIDNSGTGTVSRPFWMAETEVTYLLWQKVRSWAVDPARGTKQYFFQNSGVEGAEGSGNSDEPVTLVSWRDAIVWCNALTEYYNDQYKTSLTCVYTYSNTVIRDSRDSNATACENATADLTAKGFRLPMSMEWEMAARYKDGSTWTPGNYASGATAPYTDTAANQAVAWYDANCMTTHSVGLKTANALGIHDMSGNVWEWCNDYFPEAGRKYHGGGWDCGPYIIQLGNWQVYFTNETWNSLGLRVVMTE